MNYTNSEIQEIKKKVSLSSVAMSRMVLNRVNGEYKGLCPFHSEKTPSFTIFSGENMELFKCFGCGAHGNVIQFIQKFDKISYKEATEKAAALLGWEKGKERVEGTFRTVLTKSEKKTFPLSDMLPAEDALANSIEAQEWLMKRGIDLEIAKDFHIGYVQSAAAISPNHPWVDKGWIVFPYIEGDKITLLKYRSLMGKKTPEGKPGFLRAEGMATPMYNLDMVNPNQDLYITEGEPDTLIFAQADFIAAAFPNAGFSPTPEMRDKIMRARYIYLAGDNDKAGRDTMIKLWSELRDRIYMIEWPEGIKDANEFFLKSCKGNKLVFIEEIRKLQQIAKQRPMPNFYDMNEVLRTADDTKPMEDPKRLHFPWSSVDKMAICRPGSVVSVFATQTGTGKTTWMLGVELEEARKFGKTVVNYSAELSPQELAELTTAILVKKNRLELTKDDFRHAAKQMENAKLYVGYNPDISNIKEILGDGTDKYPGVMEWAIRRLGADVVVLDHLHFFTSGDKEATSTEAAAMTRIKNLAVKYNVIFIVVGQARKPSENKAGKVADLAAAKGSEAFSSTANTMYHLHREVKKDIDPDDPPDDILESKTSVRLYKCRTKGPGKAFAQLDFDGTKGIFYEPSYPEGVI